MKLMNKIVIMLLVLVAMLFALTTQSHATTKEELKDYMLKEKDFCGTKLIIRDTDAVKLKKFFKTHDMTDAQATKIKNLIDKAVAYMNADGAKSPNKVSTPAKKKVLIGYAKEAAGVLGLTVSYDASQERLDIYENGKLYDSLYWGVEKKSGKPTTEPKLKTTGMTNYAVFGIAGVMGIAGITLFVARKNALEANIA